MYVPYFISSHVNIVDTDVEELYVLSFTRKASFMHEQ